jgi:tetratricopeptide (TPR) repeat protein
MVCGSFYLLGSGRRKEALDQLEIAVQGDPLHLTIRLVMAFCLDAVGRHAEAEAQCRQIMEMDSHYFWSYQILAELYISRGMFTAALPLAEKALSLAPWFKPSMAIYAGLLIRSGEHLRGKEVLETLGSTDNAPLAFAFYHICCGEIDLAADRFEKAIEERHPQVVEYLQSAIAEPLRASARWPKLAAMMNQPETGVVS